MEVLKFGGTSVANATAISRVLDIVDSARSRGKVVLVCSAISGCTDSLIALSGMEPSEREKAGKAILDRHNSIVGRLFTGKERKDVSQIVLDTYKDLLDAEAEDYQTFGELFSTRIIAAKLRCDGISALWLDSRDLVRIDEGSVDKALTYRRISKAVADHPEVEVFVVPGFIGSDSTGRVRTLGRGGSDYTASLFAAALHTDDLQIWTDVPGIMTTNPKDVRSARTIPQISYDAAFMLAACGAKVLYAPAVEPAKEAGINIRILDTFHPDHPGTVVGPFPRREKGGWVGIARQKRGDESQLCLVADGPVDPAVPADLRSKLERSNIVLRGLTAVDDHILVSLAAGDEIEALRTCHYFCFETDDSVDVYLAGEGKVGRALLEIIRNTDNRINVRMVSRHEAEDEAFFSQMFAAASGKSVFVDCTDSETIYKWYVPALEAGINVVSSNRRALSVPYAEFALMKRTARRMRRFLRYETTVGAALPILDSINMSANSADEILSIEAVVSCTLNFILTSGLPFEEALKKAQEIGLTEKDPRMDLGGKDAVRKLLILGREAGIPLEEEDVLVEPVDGAQVQPGQRFVASIEKDPSAPKGYRASIRLRSVSPEDPAWNVRGTDNMISIRSAFHPSPLIIQGAGEGAKMAASSVLNDILR